MVGHEKIDERVGVVKRNCFEERCFEFKNKRRRDEPLYSTSLIDCERDGSATPVALFRQPMSTFADTAFHGVVMW